MRVLQVTNIVCHLQLPLARALAMALGPGNFRFVATEPPHDERLQLGWNFEERDPWILRAGEKETDRKEFESWWNDADIVFCGNRFLGPIKRRLDEGKLTFYMSERWWKPPIGRARILHPRIALMTKKFRQLSASPLFHYLPIGDYAACDMKWVAPFSNKMWRWGYFMAAPSTDPASERDIGSVRVLWAGRMLRWKRVDILLRAFSHLLRKRADATLTVLGTGPERERLRRLAGKLRIEESCRILPPVAASDVLGLMRQHHIYVLPSDGYEGWGAVLNEAMGEGCAVIASEAAGSAKSLISHGENGYLFAPGDWKKLAELLCSVAWDRSLLMRLAVEGRRTIAEKWVPSVAASRFLSVCEALLSKRALPVYGDGPMEPLWE